MPGFSTLPVTYICDKILIILIFLQNIGLWIFRKILVFMYIMFDKLAICGIKVWKFYWSMSKYYLTSYQNIRKIHSLNFFIYLFLARLRTIYAHQPILVFTPVRLSLSWEAACSTQRLDYTQWGWPSADGPNSYYYDGRYSEIVDQRCEINLLLIDVDHESCPAPGLEKPSATTTSSWSTRRGGSPTRTSSQSEPPFVVNMSVFGLTPWISCAASNLHPSVAGHVKIAGLFERWLGEWGLEPQGAWATPA